MNIRMRVLYVDTNGKPALGETGRLMAGQTRSVTLPIDSKQIQIIVEKDIFFENWRIIYQGTVKNSTECIRVTGVTFASRVHHCT